MGYGQYSNDYHKPFTKRELLETATRIEGRPIPEIIKSRLVAKNTLRYTMFPEPGIHAESIVYHKTRILVLTYDNQYKARPLLSVMVNTNGYNTVSTRDRLNEFLPSGWNVHTEKGFMFVRTPAGTFPHVDGATYDGATGKPHKPELHKDSRAVAVALKRKIDKFCRALDSEGFPEPCAGDPWVFDWNPRAVGEHVLLDWLDSCYVNGSLIVNALRRKGLTDTGISMAYHDMKEGRKSWSPRIKRAVRDYFKAGLGLG